MYPQCKTTANLLSNLVPDFGPHRSLNHFHRPEKTLLLKSRCRGRLTCTKGKEEGLVGVPLQQRRHASGHPLVALVDELLAEVAVDLLGRQPVVGRQRAVDEVRKLEARERDTFCF